MNRKERLAQYCNRFDPQEGLAELEHDTAQYLLIERLPMTGTVSMSTHDTLEKAGTYQATQEEAAWVALGAVDLDTGQEFSPRPALHFEPGEVYER